jgi:nitrogen fixation NifU-like protein
MSAFSAMLMEHFQEPANRGFMDSADVVGKGSLDGYPPFVTLYLRFDADRVANATFQAEGCGVTVASSSMLTELIRGRNLAECHRITAHDLAQALDGIPPGKEYCAEVAIRALQDAMKKWSSGVEQQRVPSPLDSSLPLPKGEADASTALGRPEYAVGCDHL